MARTGSSSAVESSGGAGGEWGVRGISAEMSVIWMDICLTTEVLGQAHCM